MDFSHVIAACLVLACATAQGNDICTSKHNVRCSDTDIGYKTGIWTHEACCSACKSLSGCGAWSWHFQAGTCHLHAACTQTSDPNYHAGFGSAPGPAPPAPPGGSSTIITFHWNVHTQCGQSGGSCRGAALQRFGELVRESGAQIAAGIELNGASSALPGWSTSGEYRDAVSVMVAPGWIVHKRGGGQIESGWGARGVAVMLVTPPHAVNGCPQLCVLGVHPGHSRITGGKSIVDSVCGSVADRCSIAMGDWNAGAGDVRGGSFNSWRNLIGGSPTVVAPDQKTCCHPKTCCNYDHAGTNIPGASAGTTKVWGYQLTDRYSMAEEHMPTSVHIHFPSLTSNSLANVSSSSAEYV